MKNTVVKAARRGQRGVKLEIYETSKKKKLKSPHLPQNTDHGWRQRNQLHRPSKLLLSAGVNLGGGEVRMYVFWGVKMQV